MSHLGDVAAFPSARVYSQPGEGGEKLSSGVTVHTDSTGFPATTYQPAALLQFNLMVETITFSPPLAVHPVLP